MDKMKKRTGWDKMPDIKLGDIIKSNQWSEPVEIKLLEKDEKYFHIGGVTINSRKYVEQIILREELSNISYCWF
jgi:hypothetical protein